MCLSLGPLSIRCKWLLASPWQVLFLGSGSDRSGEACWSPEAGRAVETVARVGAPEQCPPQSMTWSDESLGRLGKEPLSTSRGPMENLTHAPTGKSEGIFRKHRQSLQKECRIRGQRCVWPPLPLQGSREGGSYLQAEPWGRGEPPLGATGVHRPSGMQPACRDLTGKSISWCHSFLSKPLGARGSHRARVPVEVHMDLFPGRERLEGHKE